MYINYARGLVPIDSEIHLIQILYPGNCSELFFEPNCRIKWLPGTHPGDFSSLSCRFTHALQHNGSSEPHAPEIRVSGNRFHISNLVFLKMPHPAVRNVISIWRDHHGNQIFSEIRRLLAEFTPGDFLPRGGGPG